MVEQSTISGKNIGYDVYKEIKGEEDFDKKMEEADKVKKVSNGSICNSIEFCKS